ncbi:MAG: AMP-binding protein [Thermomicrobiales bacterium]|nr:AMP-binding protein [Thermomicrobiales bacterium]
MSHAPTVIAALDRAASKCPRKKAVVVEDRSLTYAELLDRADRLAAALRAAGLSRGDKVALLMTNRIEFAEIYFGVLKTGATLVVLNARLKAAELSPLIRKTGSRWLIFDDDLSGAVAALDPAARQPLTLVAVGASGAPGSIAYESLLSAPGRGSAGVEVGEDDDACILFTSGTTGIPKGVVLTHRNVFFQAINHIVEWDVRFDDVDLYPAPLFHGGGLATLPRTVLAADTLVLMKSFDAPTFMAVLAREHATRAVLVPTMCALILDLPDPLLAHAGSLRLIITGGGVLPVELKARLMQRFPGVGICDSYGQTESTGSVACLKPGDALRRPGSIGRAFFLNDIRLFDGEDTEVPAGEVGEIVVSGPTVMKGYFGDPESTAETLRNGWLHTGDLARRDDDGFLYLVGRKKDMIISGGVNIYPREIEEVLCTHPGILEAAVIGVADPLWGESVKALVVPRPGFTLSQTDVIDFCRERLAGYKKPRSVEIVDSLPKNSLGKIIKAELRRQFGSVFEHDP